MSDSTRWTVIHRAAEGNEGARAEFVRRYTDVIRAYLGARWRQTPLAHEIDDAAQLVFLDCFKEDGALTRLDREKGPGFRAFLYGVVRNVARNLERKRGRRRERQPGSDIDLEVLASKDESLAKVFDRAWAATLLRDAAALQLERAREGGPEAIRRHRLLELRYGDGLPIREIAARWGVEADLLHRAYPRARDEFRRALLDVVREMQGGGPEGVEGECARLLAHFSRD